MSRPRKTPSVLSTRLAEHDVTDLEILAFSAGLSRSEYVRQIITDHLTNNRKATA
jgi:hypothetical protein